MTSSRRESLQNVAVSLAVHLAVLGAMVSLIRAEARSPAQEIEVDLSQLSVPRPQTPSMVQPQQFQPAASPSQSSPWLIPRYGDYVPSEAVARQPRWVEGLWGYYSSVPEGVVPPGTSGDFSTFLTVEVFVDETGRVAGASVAMGGNEALDAFVVEKLKAARFEPALDTAGRSVPCKLTFPVFIEIFRDPIRRGQGSILNP